MSPEPSEEFNDALVVDAVREFERESGVLVSQLGLQTLIAIVRAIHDDPLPEWNRPFVGQGEEIKVDPRQLIQIFGLSEELPSSFTTTRELQALYISSLSIFLGAIPIPERRETRTITTFDILHYLTAGLDAICPIKKRK